MNIERYVIDKEKENGKMKRVSLNKNSAIRNNIFSESDENSSIRCAYTFSWSLCAWQWLTITKMM